MNEYLDKFFLLLMFDVDRFKIINDIYGYLVGDEVLIEIINFIN